MLITTDCRTARVLASLAATAMLLAALPASGLAAAEFDVTITADHRALPAAPVTVQLPAALHGVPLRLVDVAADKSVAIQADDETGKQAVFMADALAAGQSRRYRLSAAPTTQPQGADQRAGAPRVVVDQDAQRLRVSVGGRPVLQYNIQTVEPPAGMPAYYRRSGYLHPVFDPAGRVVTGDFAADHAHQHGIFFAWVKTTFAGRPVDFWNQADQSGRVAHTQLPQHGSGDVFGQFRAVLAHAAPAPAAADAQPVLREIWTVRVYDVPADDPQAPFVFDVQSVQQCVADEPLVLEEYHYGGMAVRGTTEWLGHPEHGFLTSQGKRAADGNHSRPRWVDMFGPIDGQPSGIAVLDHPDNFRFPQPVRLHPSKPYFCFAPMVLGRFQISPGDAYVSKYRFVIHQGGTDRRLLRQQWQAYAHPPRVDVAEIAAAE